MMATFLPHAACLSSSLQVTSIGRWLSWTVVSSLTSCGAPATSAAPPAASMASGVAPATRVDHPPEQFSSTRPSARSAAQRLMLLMAMGSPEGASVQLLSQGCGQVRPMMAGSGLSRLTMVVARLACSSRLWKM